MLVVAPTTARAEAGCAALRKRGAQVALLPGEWPQARAGAHVVIGTRGAVWGPCPGMSSVIVLDAHDEGLVQEQAPTWDAPAVAAERARRAGVPCFWVTPCPTVDLLMARRRAAVHEPGCGASRVGGAVGGRLPPGGPSLRPLFGPAGREAPECCGPGRLRPQPQRPGRCLDCAACGDVATCEQCGAGVASVGEQLTCRCCQATRPVVCASCGSDALRLLRVGVSRAREQLEALAGRAVGEVAAGSASLPAAPILVGTEAVLYREADLRRDVEVVAFLDFDQEMFAPRYRAPEEALGLFARARRGWWAAGCEGARCSSRRARRPTRSSRRRRWPTRAGSRPQRNRCEGRCGCPRSLPWPCSAVPAPGNWLAPCPWNSSAPKRRWVCLAAVGMTGLGSGLEVSEAAEGRWVVRAPDASALADALARAGRPARRVRVDIGPPRL